MADVYLAALVAALSFDVLITKLFVATLPVVVFALFGDWALGRFGHAAWTTAFRMLQGYSLAWLLFSPRTGVLSVDAISFGVLLISAWVMYKLKRSSSCSKDLV